jgi:hypothetical protein
MTDGFTSALVASAPHPGLGRHAATYARLIGGWRGTLRNHMTGAGAPPTASVEAHFAWVLEGRAVQDTWITPARHAGGADSGMRWYGTTLRVFDPKLEAWRTTWTDPLSQLVIELIGRSQGDDIVQLGTRDGRPIRWTFSNVQPRSFTWQGHILNPDGRTWDLEVDIAFERTREA